MDIEQLLKQPAHRRGWLLIKALECAPLDRAIGLARDADRFVVGDDSAVDTKISAPASIRSHSELGPACDQAEAISEGLAVSVHSKPSRLSLTPSQRAELLDQATKGANNAQLAAAFGLTPRQVQAIRMGAARTAAAERAPAARAAAPQQFDGSQTVDSMISAATEDVVRYLRQQDDVVVPAGDGMFLVNGRFRLGLTELIAKANRARERQNKPLFKATGVEHREAQSPLRN
jgi:hypothetical protein